MVRLKATADTNYPYRMDWNLGSLGKMVFDKRVGGIKVIFNLTRKEAKDLLTTLEASLREEFQKNIVFKLTYNQMSNLAAILSVCVEALEQHLKEPAHPTKKQILEGAKNDKG